MKTKAAVARAKSAPLSLETLEIEQPRPNEILVRVHATGICHTDLAMRDQVFPVPQPIVLGHEGAGVVAAVGAEITKFSVGDHVALSFSSCGSCAPCAAGAPSYCAKSFELNFCGGRLDGSSALSKGEEKIHSHFFGQSVFSEYAVCNERNAVRVDKDLPFEVLAPLGCGIVTGAGTVMNVFRMKKGQSIVVFGAGAVGLAVILAARALGAGPIIAVGRNQLKMNMAREFGATHLVEGSSEAVAMVKQILPGGADFTVDTTASTVVIERAVACLGPRGVCALLGVSHPTETLSLNLIDTISSGKSVRGVVEGDAIPQDFIPRLIELYRAGQFSYDKMITCYPFAEINQAIHDAETGKIIKAVIRM